MLLSIIKAYQNVYLFQEIIVDTWSFERCAYAKDYQIVKLNAIPRLSKLLM